MLKLTDRKWKEFNISDLFILSDNNKQVPTGSHINKQDILKGKTPRITVKSSNNGIDDFWCINPKKIKEYKNFISISFLGQAFYHFYNASLDMKVHCLQLKNRNLNKYIGLFIINMLNNKFDNFSYGNQLSSSDLPNKKIYLPMTSDFQPDYDFMEAYMREKEEKLKNEYKKFISSKIQQEYIKPQEPKKWKEFKIEEIFKIYTGTDLILKNIKKGEIPVISHAAINNGISDYSNIIEQRKRFDCTKTISLADRGNFKAFVQPVDFYIGTRVKALETKNKLISKYSLIFITQLIDKQSVKFSYGNNACNRLGELKILLPSAQSSQPDYKYMENYMKYFEQQKLLEYLKFIERA